MSRHSKKEHVIILSLVIFTATLAFLAGYGFEKFVEKRTKSLNINKRTLYHTDSNIFYKRNFESRDRTPGDVAHEDAEYHDTGEKSINTTYIENMLRYLTKEPHRGGTDANTRLAHFIESEWKPHGFDKVELKEYDVLLSSPKNPAIITLKDAAGETIFDAKTTEDAFFEEENSTDSVYPFNAYSHSGDVEGEYVFINYGETRDYLWLDDHNISVQGKVVIAKYGYAFRGEKARLAQEHGALGLLLYGDPEDYVAGDAKGTYPDTWDLPPGAIPRGNIANVKGDPLTPLYAAKDGMFRRKEESISHLSKIPVTPMSYADAHVFLSKMDGVEVPDPNWQGGMNFTYHVTSETKNRIHMVVDTPREVRRISNVVATIVGETEPDRILILGNHRDGWVFGAGDPSSGTSCLMAVAKAMGAMLTAGWRPRRTIMLISWDAEEYGLMGSVEWVQEMQSILTTRAVSYINVDIAVSGNYSVRAKATPLMIDRFFDVTKQFVDPDSNSDGVTPPKSLYTAWKEKMRDSQNLDEPSYSSLGSGSDFTPFYSSIGIPCIDMRYSYDTKYYHKLSNYPAYHTIYDNFNYYQKFIDPDFRYHTLISKLLLRYTIELADELVLPFNLTRYAKQIFNDADTFAVTFEEIFKPQNITMALVKKAAYELVLTAEDFHRRLGDLNKNDCHSTRRFNDQMMNFERAFILPEGLPNRRDMKHAIYSPARKTLFSRKTFPGVTEPLYDIEINGVDRWDNVREQISVLASVLNSARNTLLGFKEL